MPSSRRTSLHGSLAGAAMAAVLALCQPAAAAAGNGVWTMLPGPPLGAITAVAVDAANPRIVYAGSAVAGLFKSVDGGVRWQAADRGLPVAPVTFVAVDPVDESVWAATNDATGIGRGFRSDDGGANWSELPAGSPVNAGLQSLAFDPRSRSLLYAGTLIGLFRSTDGGDSWQAAGGGLPSGVEVFAVAVDAADSAVFAATAGGLFRSLDSGSTWSAANPAPGLVNGVQLLAVDSSAPAAIYAVNVSAGVFRSDDGGATWTAAHGLTGLRDGRRAVISLAIDGGNPSTLYALSIAQADGTGILFRSDDRGATWSPVDVLARSLILAGLVAVPGSPQTLLSFGTSGIFSSADGATSFRPSGGGLPAPGIANVTVDAQEPARIYAATLGGQLWRSLDAGVSWDLRLQSGVGPLALHPAAPFVLYAGVAGGVLASFDGGDTWRALGGAPCLLPRALVIDLSHPQTLYLAGQGDPACDTRTGTFRSTDGGTTWSALGGLGEAQVTQLAVDLADDATIYALTSTALLRSVDEGATWRPADTGLGGATPFELAASPADPHSLYLVAADGEVFRSTDRAGHWQRRGAGPVRGTSLFLAADPVRPHVLYALGGHLAFRSLDGGVTWSPLGSGLGAAHLSGALAVAPTQPETLYAGTRDQGLWSLTPPP
jgi:photosystem II stability/assembly factor-like uncharacterized protein